MPDQFDIETFTGSTFSTIPYNEKRREPLPGELPMIKMEIYDDLAANSHAISNRVSEKIPQDTSQIYYYKNNYEIVLYSADSNDKNADIWIQGERYPFSFGESSYLRNGENPEICFFDVNQDGSADILIRSEF